MRLYLDYKPTLLYSITVLMSMMNSEIVYNQEETTVVINMISLLNF